MQKTSKTRASTGRWVRVFFFGFERLCVVSKFISLSDLALEFVQSFLDFEFDTKETSCHN